MEPLNENAMEKLDELITAIDSIVGLLNKKTQDRVITG